MRKSIRSGSQSGASQQLDLPDHTERSAKSARIYRGGSPRRSFRVGGKVVPSLTALAAQTGVPIATLHKRLKRGISVEEALTPQPHRGHLPIVVEGVPYSSRAAAARAYGFKPNLVTMRLSTGWTLDEALEITPRERKGEGGVVYLVRHLESGMGYIGITTLVAPLDRWTQHIEDAMAKTNRGKNENGLQHAIRRDGMAAFRFEVVAEANTDADLSRLEVQLIGERCTKAPGGYNLYRGGGSFRREGHSITVGDRTFPNLREACRRLGKNYVLVAHRLNAEALGHPSWTIDEAFDRQPRAKPNKSGSQVIIDGVPHVSLKAAYKALKLSVSYDAVVKRLAAGWTLEEAFDLRVKLYRNHTSKGVEVAGRRYSTVDEAYNTIRPTVSLAMVYHRIRSGQSPTHAFYPSSLLSEWMEAFTSDGRKSYPARELYAMYENFVETIPGAEPLSFRLWGCELKRIAKEHPTQCRFLGYRHASGPRYQIAHHR